MELSPTSGLGNSPRSDGSDGEDQLVPFAVHEVSIDYRGLTPASFGPRLAAHFIDLVTAYGGCFMSAHIIASTGASVSWRAIAIVPFALYALLADGLGSGQSLGKRLMNIAVVDARSGASCGFGRSIVRNLLRTLGILDWAFMFFGAGRRRLGDWAAGTVVVDVKPQRK